MHRRSRIAAPLTALALGVSIARSAQAQGSVPVAPADTTRIARVVTGVRPTVEVTNRAP